MKKYNKLWQCFYAVGLMAIAIQQLVCKDFRPVILPTAFPAWLQAARLTCTWIFSVLLIAACLSILLNIKARTVSLITAFILLLMAICFHVPFVLSGAYAGFLGTWTDPLKCLTLSGGAFVVAGTFSRDMHASGFIYFLEKLIPLGKFFVAITMLLFGIDHFLYTQFVVTLVPTWIPGSLFWTYFAGAALALSGLAIIINIKRKLAANLLGLMIFLWLIMLHIPRAVADPHSGNGNEWTSVFEALAFSGIAFLIASES